MTAANESVELIVVPPTHDLGDNFEVRRALPTARRRMVGPFVFLDQMGPAVFAAGRGLDVRPHPHIGLATVSYLFRGEIFHRDSVGSAQAIRPGEVNWMTAGRGIVHSERTGEAVRASGGPLFGLQCWVALPKAHEEAAPAFVHHAVGDLPEHEGEGAWMRLIAGELGGMRSPVPALSPLFYADLQLQPGAGFVMRPEYGERALYVVSGVLDLGADGVFEAGRLLVLRPGVPVTLRARVEAVRVMLLGGEPMSESRYIVWNFVSSSVERIEQAKEDWRQQRFAQVPGENEFIPLPETLGRPVGYP